jgi:DinB superfamily
VDLEILQYPIGRSVQYIENGPQDRGEWLQIIADTPAEVRRVVSGLTEPQLDTPYRPGGWTVRQVVHHYADDHLNSYVRFKLALTENEPAIKSYGEALWAELPDARLGPIEPSLSLLEALHCRWIEAWRSMAESDWLRTFCHPKRGLVSLKQLAALYAWHGKHHVAQIRALRVRNGWTEKS